MTTLKDLLQNALDSLDEDLESTVDASNFLHDTSKKLLPGDAFNQLDEDCEGASQDEITFLTLQILMKHCVMARPSKDLALSLRRKTMSSIFQIASSKSAKNELGEPMMPTVYVMAECDISARAKAIEAFKRRIEEHDQDFDELEGMSEEDLAEAYEFDAYLEALHCGAKGHCSCRRNVGDSSEVVYE